MTLAFGDLAKKAMLVRIGKRVCTCIALPGEGGVLGEAKTNHVATRSSRRVQPRGKQKSRVWCTV